MIRNTALALVAALAAPAALAQDSAGVTATAVPSMSERDANVRVEVRGLRVTEVGAHAEQGITPQTVQAVADAQFAKLAAGASSAWLDFAQLQAVADAITEEYRRAGFLVSVAYLPPQNLGADKIVEIRVMEGRIGKVIVQGNQRYDSRTVGDAAQRLQGRPLRKADIDSALLYARDLPGVSVSSVLQPGENEGETDLVLVASESGRPWAVNLSVDSYGTETSGRGRAQAGLTWGNPLGRGDMFAISGIWQFDPSASRNGAVSYSLPIRGVTGLSVLAGANQSELEINSGPLALLDLRGPAAQRYAGADWKFVNTQMLQLTSSLRYIHETSRFEAMGMKLSDHRYDVAELGLGMRHNDAGWRGVNLAQLSVRRSLHDGSAPLDVVNPNRDSQFTLARLGLMRMQYLTRTQRLLFKFNGQWTNNALPAMEQFQLGGHDSVRGYGQGESLGDRGYFVGLEYQVDAPGFADKASPFQGLAWREVLTLDVFADHGKVSNIYGPAGPWELASAGAGMTFRLPRFYNLELRLAGAVPTSSAEPSDGRNARLYARLGMTF
ncbi:ShlB/FhaC/HecB family hemolysin secretion/activation protein [Stenotrophomonas sp. SY1]|uniref:ShlB/FhaC/HecB family hemolysin secretion/activation protein n=1 Tax=Stenotrophomonas sp. SY1 TaxID=477235 RepID=UPI001E57E919|nr:ShlB/FhaC/HecB family hemolysin secretion/activation protein [Stenotrophomonas sp. SY1]MCD9087834.1 BamA/TamA family outer membrane protein [Stenotrophomonas sp. SY1]